MKYLVLLLFLFVSCGDSTTNSTTQTDDSDEQATNNPFPSDNSSESSSTTEDSDNEDVTSISGSVQYYEDDISLVKIYFVNSKGDVETTSIDEDYNFEIELTNEISYKCFMSVDDLISDTIQITDLGSNGTIDNIEFRYASYRIWSVLQIDGEESYTSPSGKLQFSFEDPYTLSFDDEGNATANVDGYWYAVTFSAESDKEAVMDEIFFSTGSYPYDGVTYHFLSNTYKGIVFKQDVYFGFESDNYILVAHFEPSTELGIEGIEPYLELMKYVEIVE